MGVAKSLRKAGHLQMAGSGLESIGDYLDKMRKAEEQKQFINNIIGAYDKWKQGQQRAEEEGLRLKEGGKVSNPFSPTTIPETQTKTKSPEERYKEAESNFAGFISEIAPMIMNPNIDQQQIERTNVLSVLARNQVERLKPKKSVITERDPFKRYISTDEYGNEKVIQEAGEKPKLYDVEGNMKNPKTGTYWSYDKQKGNYFDTGVPYDKNEGRGSTTINMSPSYGDLIGKVNKGIKDIKSERAGWTNDGKGNWYPPLGSKYYKTGKDGGDLGYTKQEHDAIMENMKSEYIAPAIQLVNEQGLDNAVEIIQGGINKGKSFNEVIIEFKKSNPDLDKEDERILRDYFNLLAQ